MGVEGQRLGAAILVLTELIHQLVHHDRGLFGVSDHVGQRQGFRDGEAVGRVNGQRPGDVADALTDLISQLRGFATQLHGWIEVNLDPAFGRGFDVVDPLGKEYRVHRCGCGQHAVQLERHLCGIGAAHESGGGECSAQAGQGSPACHVHGHSSPPCWSGSPCRPIVMGINPSASALVRPAPKQNPPWSGCSPAPSPCASSYALWRC